MTVPLVNAAVNAASTNAPSVKVVLRELYEPDAYWELQSRVGGADKDDILVEKGIIVAHVYRDTKGMLSISPKSEKFRIIRGKGTDPKTGKPFPPTKTQVAAEVTAYLKATSEPPPGSMAALRIEAERAEAAEAAANGQAKPAEKDKLFLRLLRNKCE